MDTFCIEKERPFLLVPSILSEREFLYPRIFSSWLHTRGFPFAILAFALLIPVIWVLRRMGRIDGRSASRGEAARVKSTLREAHGTDPKVDGVN